LTAAYVVVTYILLSILRKHLLKVEPSGSHPKKGESAKSKTGGSHS